MSLPANFCSVAATPRSSNDTRVAQTRRPAWETPFLIGHLGGRIAGSGHGYNAIGGTHALRKILIRFDPH